VVGGAIIIAGVAISQWHHGEEKEGCDEEPEDARAPVAQMEFSRLPSRPDIRSAVERLVASSKEAQRLK